MATGKTVSINNLYYGDNLQLLRDFVDDETVDLVYLDPPFNSNSNYALIFKGPTGSKSDAQIEAFEDTWHWGPSSEQAFDEILTGRQVGVSELLRAMRSVLGESDLMAYLTMMAVRLLELRRVLKPTGSLYLHCDPTASHYLKLLLDAVFGRENFRNEIVWKRTRGHHDKSAVRFGAVHDVLLFYSRTRSKDRVFKRLYLDREEGAPKTHDLYTHSDGTVYRKGDCRAPGGRGPRYEWNGHTQNWRFTPEERQRLEEDGRIVYTKTGMPRVLRNLDLARGASVQDVWTDIDPPNSGSDEFLGYPTQKPTALLERIIESSSNEGDLVLDPFVGGGTTLHAAERLKRRWIGMDVTHLAISLIERRMEGAFPGIDFDVHGLPTDIAGAEELAARDKYQFQWWAVSLVKAVPYGGKKKGADGGVDGMIYFKPDLKSTEKAIVSVKGGKHVDVTMVRELSDVVNHQKAKMGVLITLVKPTDPMIKKAVSEGFYKTPFGDFPRIQILTVADLFSGKRPAMPFVDASALKKGVEEIKEKQVNLF